MNRTVHLAERLLIRGRQLHQIGLNAQALRVFERLSHLHNLPAPMRNETHRRLTQLNAKARKFKRARRHLAPLLAQNPDHAEYQFLMARLVEADIHCDSARAREHYRKALRLDPNNPRYLSSYGIFALKNDRPKTALRMLRRAYRLSPEHPLVLKRYIKCLQQLGRIGEARSVLEQSRFRLGKLGWFEKLRLDFRFFALHYRQEMRARNRAAAQEPPCLLPFRRSADNAAPHEESEFVRSDRASVLPPPHLSKRLRRPDQRHAQ